MRSISALPVTAVLVASSLALSGCRIELSVSAGGSIVTDSGRFSCSPGENCPLIEVIDLFFDETFIAQADSGFEFVGWKRRDRGLCGGSKNDCRLFTSGFAGNDALLAFLENDDVFYLEAVFAPASGSGSGVGSASSCWHESLFMPGTQQESEYRVTTPLGDAIEVRYSGMVEAGVIFNGKSARRLVLDVVSSGDPDIVSVSRAYFQIPQARRINDLGSEADVLSPETATAVTTNDPHRLRRFDLAAGESHSQSYVVTTDTSTGQDSQSLTVSVDSTISFDGVETVTVPAGTFEACRFTELSTTNGRTEQQREWVDVASGLLIKAENDAQLTELVSATVNGSDI